MENILQWPEIVYGSLDTVQSRAISNAVKNGKLLKLAPRLYTSNLDDAPKDIIKRNQYQIIAHLFPGAVISHRSALEGGVSKHSIYLSYKYTKNISLPGLTIHLLEGLGQLDGDTPFMEGLYFASRARALLENLKPSRGKKNKCLERATLETYINKLCQTYGEKELNNLRDEAKKISKLLNLKKEHATLDKLIGTLLGTQNSIALSSPVAIARAAGLPYDTQRIELFASLASALLKDPLSKTTPQSSDPRYIRNLAFFESYFSNYIEGTEFEVGEAAKIIFQNRVLTTRPEDSHDILSTFKLISNYGEIITPQNPEELMASLLTKHSELMMARPETSPGEFKSLANRAGNTKFVQPELVKGTLIKGFEFYKGLPSGIARAIFMMFYISEIHPFTDGNGRISRIMMNAELTANNQSRIIIPTVYREDYLLTLRRLSREFDPTPYIRMLMRAQSFTNSIDFTSYHTAIDQLHAASAFMEPSEGKLNF